MSGRIVAIRVSSAAIYGNNFKPKIPFESTQHTVLLYQFEEGKGNEVRDLSKGQHHGRIVGARWVKLNP